MSGDSGSEKQPGKPRRRRGRGKVVRISKLPAEMRPMFFIQSVNRMLATFREGRFGIVSAVPPGPGNEADLARQSRLADRLKELKLDWLPVVLRRDGGERRCLFVFDAAAEQVAAVAAEFRLDGYAWGERGRWVIYEAETGLPADAGDELGFARVDADFVVYRERAGAGG